MKNILQQYNTSAKLLSLLML